MGEETPQWYLHPRYRSRPWHDNAQSPSCMGKTPFAWLHIHPSRYSAQTKSDESEELFSRFLCLKVPKWQPETCEYQTLWFKKWFTGMQLSSFCSNFLRNMIHLGGKVNIRWSSMKRAEGVLQSWCIEFYRYPIIRRSNYKRNIHNQWTWKWKCRWFMNWSEHWSNYHLYPYCWKCNQKIKRRSVFWQPWEKKGEKDSDAQA